MALLNPPDMTPDVVRQTVEATRELGGRASRDNVISYCAPGHIGGGESRTVATSLNAAITLGLIDEDQGDLRVSTAAATAFDRDGSARRDWPRLLTSSVLSHVSAPDSISARTADSEEARTAGVRDLVYALTWLLAQDAFGTSLAWKPGEHTRSLQDLQYEQLGPDRDKWALLNDTRPAPFARWAVAMGLANRPAVGEGTAFTPNPTAAIRRVTMDLIAAGELQDGKPIQEFVDRIGSELPVLWPGTFRAELVDALGGDPDPDVGGGEGVDSSVGLALLALRTAHVIRVEDRADSTNRLLIGRSSNDPVRVTHVSTGKGRP